MKKELKLVSAFVLFLLFLLVVLFLTGCTKRVDNNLVNNSSNNIVVNSNYIERGKVKQNGLSIICYK